MKFVNEINNIDAFFSGRKGFIKRVDGQLKTRCRLMRERDCAAESLTTEKENESLLVRHDNISDCECFLRLKRMILFLSVILSTTEIAHDRDSTPVTVLITDY